MENKERQVIVTSAFNSGYSVGIKYAIKIAKIARDYGGDIELIIKTLEEDCNE